MPLRRSAAFAFAFACASAAGCASFATHDSTTGDAGTSPSFEGGFHVPGDAAAQDSGRDARAADASGHDASGHDASGSGRVDADASSADVGPPGALDTACTNVWTTPLGCPGRTSTSIGKLESSDDARLSLALSKGGTLGLCYAEDTSDFLTRHLIFLTSTTPPGTFASITYDSGETDTTGACVLAGGPGDTFHALISDTANTEIAYGVLVPGSTPIFEPLGPNPISGYFTLGLATFGAGELMAVVGDVSSGTIVSYLGSADGGAGMFGSAVSVASGLGFDVVGSGAFSLRSNGGSPTMLIDDGPSDASASRADLAVWNGSAWKTTTVEGAMLQAVVGYSPALALTDAGARAAYFERGLGSVADGGRSQLHLATLAGGPSSSITTPLPSVLDNDPENPTVAVASAIAPDGRLFLAYVAPGANGKVSLYLVRPESSLPGAPLIQDTIDDALSVADVTSVQMLIEPSGRIDVAYTRLVSQGVYLAVRQP
jgi:hypothetical protein